MSVPLTPRHDTHQPPGHPCSSLTAVHQAADRLYNYLHKPHSFFKKVGEQKALLQQLLTSPALPAHATLHRTKAGQLGPAQRAQHVQRTDMAGCVLARIWGALHLGTVK